MKRFNRLWALLLAFALMITYMPAMAFAEGDMASKSAEDASISFDEDNPAEIWSDDEYDFTFTTDGLDDVEGYSIEYSVGVDNEPYGPIMLDAGWAPLEDGRTGVHIDGDEIWEAANNAVYEENKASNYYIFVSAEVFLDGESLCEDAKWIEVKLVGEEEPVKFSVVDVDTGRPPYVEELSAGDSITVKCSMQRRTSDTHEWVAFEDAEYDSEATGSLSVTKDEDDVFTIQRTSAEEGSVVFYASYTDSSGETASSTADFYVWEGGGDEEDKKIHFDCEEDPTLYSDEDLTLDVESDLIGESGYSVAYDVFFLPYGAEDDEKVVLQNDENTTYFDADATGITLYGQPISEACGKKGYLTVSVELIHDGYTVAGDQVYVELYMAETLTYFDFSEKLLDDYFYIYQESWGTITSDGYDEEEFDFEVEAVRKTDPDDDRYSVTWEDDERSWVVKASEAGVYDITVTYYPKDEEDPVTEDFELTFVEEKASVDIDRTDGRVDARLLPTQTATVKATGELIKAYYDEEGGYWNRDYIDEGLEYHWVFTDPDYENYAVLENANTEEVTIRVKKDVAAEAIENNEEFEVKAQMYYEGDLKAESEAMGFCLDDEYYEINPATMSENLNPGQTFTFDPTAYNYKYEDGELVTTDLGKEFAWEFEPGTFTVKDVNGKDVINNYEDEEDTEPVTSKGPFKVTRKTDDSCWFNIDFSNEDSPIIGQSYSFHEKFNLSKAKVSAIKDRVYSGKAQKPVPGTVYVIDEDGDRRYLDNGYEYKITYKNNKNVGAASVILTASDEYYYGSKTISFNILPKATKLSKLTAGRKSFTVTWKKQATQTTGYEIQYGLKKNFKGAKTLQVKKNKTTKATIKKLKGGKTYYVRIRTYKKIGKKYYRSAWSSAKKIKVKR